MHSVDWLIKESDVRTDNTVQYMHSFIRAKNVKGKAAQWPRRFQEVKVPRFHDNGTGWC